MDSSVLCGCMSSTHQSSALLLCHGCVCWVSHERREYSVSAAPARREQIHLKFLWLLEFSSSFHARTLSTMGVHSVHGETQWDSGRRQQDTPQAGQPEAPLDGGHRGPQIACATTWLRSSQCGLQWKTGRWWAGEPWKDATGSEFPFAEQGGRDCRWHGGVGFLDCLEDKHGWYSPWCCASAQRTETLGRTRGT